MSSGGVPPGADPEDKPAPDVVAPDLDVLFCGIDPSLASASRRHHFARPGNRSWPALHLAGLTPRLLTPDEDRELPAFGLGVTNVVARPTRTAAELDADELRADAVAFDRPRAVPGLQPERVGGAATWVVPNPSGAQRPLPAARPRADLR